MGTRDESADYARLNINIHKTLMTIFRKYADRYGTSVTEQVRRAGAILDEVEKVQETPNAILGICTLDPKTGEVVKVRELRMVG